MAFRFHLNLLLLCLCCVSGNILLNDTEAGFGYSTYDNDSSVTRDNFTESFQTVELFISPSIEPSTSSVKQDVKSSTTSHQVPQSNNFTIDKVTLDDQDAREIVVTKESHKANNDEENIEKSSISGHQASTAESVLSTNNTLLNQQLSTESLSGTKNTTLSGKSVDGNETYSDRFFDELKDISDTIVNAWQITDSFQGFMFSIANSISCIGISVTFACYCYFNNLFKSRRGFPTLNLLLALFFATLGLQIGPFFKEDKMTCFVLTVCQHYFCLVTFLWLNCIAHDVMIEAWEFRDKESLKIAPSKGLNKKTQAIYGIFSWGLPVIIVSLSASKKMSSDFEIPYGNPAICGVFGGEGMFYTMAFPVAIISLLNMIFFTFGIKWLPASRLFCKCTPSGREVNETTPIDEKVKCDSPSIPTMKIMATQGYVRNRRVWGYVRTSMVISLTWLSGFMALYTEKYWIGVCFLTFNALEGVIIFISLVLNRQVVNVFLENYLKRTSIAGNIISKEKNQQVSCLYDSYQASSPVAGDGYALINPETEIVFIQ